MRATPDLCQMKQMPKSITILVANGYNMSATISFLDPFRAANYLAGEKIYHWRVAHAEAAPPTASNGLALAASPLGDGEGAPDIGVVSTSWTPERTYQTLAPILRRWSRHGAAIAGLDTGAFVVAAAGLASGRRITVHYEHIDALAETFPDVEVSEDLYVIDGPILTASGGGAATDLALQVVRRDLGEALANAVARYLFHERIRPEGSRQLAVEREPIGATAPGPVREAIRMMEAHLEEVVSIPEIAAALGVSLSTLERRFRRHVGKTPARYYADIRLDRARGLVVQTDLPVGEISLACGFASAEHFSRSYARRFGAPPQSDRLKGRVPFEFRAWPMHERGGRL